MTLEYRRVSGLHVRTVPDRREGRVIADVMIYNKIDDYRTSFAPGVFDESLRDHLPKMLWAHNMMEPIGRWVEVDDNSQRLRMVGELDLEMVTAPDGRVLDIPAVPMAHRAWAQLNKRTIDQFSVGFVRLNDSPHRSVRGATQIDRAWLDEASPVLVGSVPGTQLVGVRSAQRGAPLARERRSVFLFENGRGKVDTMTTTDEERANPVGYNQYKHMPGRKSGAAVPPGAANSLPGGKKTGAATSNGQPGKAHGVADAHSEKAMTAASKGDTEKVQYHMGASAAAREIANMPDRNSAEAQVNANKSRVKNASQVTSEDQGRATGASEAFQARFLSAPGSAVPTDKGGTISKTQAAEKMFGTGSKQHLAAIKKFGA